MTAPPYHPPRPQALSPIVSLVRLIMQGDGDLLSLLPADAYRMPIGHLGYSRRQILIVNDPQLFKPILLDPRDIYPKNDLMVDALQPLVGNSIFVSNGAEWRKQRRMVDPTFSHMRLSAAFPAMAAGVAAFEGELDESAASGEGVSLDLAMSHLTADIICRTVFSTSFATKASREVFDAFALFERSVAQVEWKRLIFDAAWTPVPQKPDVQTACHHIRALLGEMLDAHQAYFSTGAAPPNDICTEIVNARDLETGATFSREQLIDQLGVMFLAGHETSASALTWVFFILTQQPQIVARMRAEIDRVVGDGEIGFEHLRSLTFIRSVFRETVRLYPPITFIPRVAAEATKIGKYKVKRGAMIMISPWTIHRNENYWKNANVFDPDRFSIEREDELVAGAYLPFGLGPRVCVGAAFATTEATLIMARLIRRFDFTASNAANVRPVARLTTRPKEQIMLTVSKRT
jgi:cytochrome P450